MVTHNVLLVAKTVISEDKAAGGIGVWYIVLICFAVALPLIGGIVYCLCCRKKTEDFNKDDHYQAVAKDVVPAKAARSLSKVTDGGRR